MARTFLPSSMFLAMAKKAGMQIPPLAIPPPLLQHQPNNVDTRNLVLHKSFTLLLVLLGERGLLELSDSK